MSGGDFPLRVNREIVSIQRVTSPAGVQQLRTLIQDHAARTGSRKAQAILRQWADYLPRFWQVVPPSEAATPEAQTAEPAIVV